MATPGPVVPARRRRFRWSKPLALALMLAGIGPPPVRGQTVPGPITLRERVATPGAGKLISTLVFAPDGQSLATTERGGKVRIRSVTDLRETQVLTGHSVTEAELRERPERRERSELSQDAFRAVFYPDGQTLATSGRDGSVRVWDLATGSERFRLTNHVGSVHGLVVSADGHLLISGDAASLPTTHVGSVRFWDARTGQRLPDRIADDSRVGDLALSTDGHKIAATSINGTARLWDVATGKPLAVCSGPSRTLNRVAIAPDGQTAVTTGSDQIIRVFDASTGQQRHQIAGANWAGSSLSYSPDGERLATATADRAVVWNTRDWTEAASLTIPDGRVTQAIFAPDGKTLGVSGEKGSVRLLTLEP